MCLHFYIIASKLDINYASLMSHTSTQTFTHKHAYTHTSMHTHKHAHTQACTHTSMHTHPCTHTHAHTQARMHTHKHACTRTSAHMDTLTSNCLTIARTSSIFPLGRSWLNTEMHLMIFYEMIF